MEAAAVLRRHRRAGDPGAHPAGGDGAVGPLHAVQHPEEGHDGARVPTDRQQRQVGLGRGGSVLPPASPQPPLPDRAALRGVERPWVGRGKLFSEKQTFAVTAQEGQGHGRLPAGADLVLQEQSASTALRVCL